MPLSLPEFLCQMTASPALTLTVLLTLAVLLVNGWTDAPNAIAAAVVTGALPFRPAVGLAALCNLLGVLCVTAVNTSVAETIYSIASFGGGPRAALAALCAAMASIVLWAAAAWWFGIPTSESHALVAGLSGAAAALPGGLTDLFVVLGVEVFFLTFGFSEAELSTMSAILLIVIGIMVLYEVCKPFDWKRRVLWGAMAGSSAVTILGFGGSFGLSPLGTQAFLVLLVFL